MSDSTGRRAYPNHPRDRAAGDRRRERILDAAIEELAAFGWAGASTSRIAAAAGLQPPGLHYHFPTKTDLLLAALEHTDAATDRAMHAEVGAEPTGIRALEGLVATVATCVERPGFARLSAGLSTEASAPDHPAAPWMRERHRAIRAWCAANLAEAVAADDIRADVDPTTAAAGLYAAAEGAVVQWLIDPESIDPVAVVRAQLDALRPPTS